MAGVVVGVDELADLVVVVVVVVVVLVLVYQHRSPLAYLIDAATTAHRRLPAPSLVPT